MIWLALIFGFVAGVTFRTLRRLADDIALAEMIDREPRRGTGWRVILDGVEVPDVG